VLGFNIKPPASETNPFDRLPKAHRSGPQGAEFTVPGYHGSNDQYTFRISFPTAGDWSVSSEETDDAWQVTSHRQP